MEDTISVIVPIYNAENYLDRCISSIVNQTYKNLEIILINDGSIDNSLEICEKWKEKDERIILINKENTGVSDTRNKGLDIATGKYISFVDGDDYIEIDMMEKLIKKIKNENSKLIICGYNYILKNNINSEVFENFKEFNKNEYLKNAFKMDQRVWNKLFVRDIINGLRFEKKISIGEDTLFLYNYLDKIDKISFIREKLYNYNQLNINSLTYNCMASKCITLIKARYFISNILSKYNIQERYNIQADSVCNYVIYKEKLGKGFDYAEYEKIIKEYMDNKLLFKVKGIKNKIKIFFAYYFEKIYLKCKTGR